MLPANQHEHFIDRAFIALLFLICKDDNSPVLSLKCPNEVRMVGATEILGVYTEAEHKAKVISELKEQNKELNKQIKELQERVQQLEDKIKTRQKYKRRDRIQTFAVRKRI